MSTGETTQPAAGGIPGLRYSEDVQGNKALAFDGQMRPKSILDARGQVVIFPTRPVRQGNIGFNMYDALYAKFFDATDDSARWQYMADSGAQLVRVMYPAFYSTDYTSYVFAAGVPDRDFVDADFRATFLTESDAMFDAALSYRLRLHVGLFWSQESTAAVRSETLATGYISSNTDTAVFMQRFARWFAGRYASHDGLYCYSIGNEWVCQESAISNPQNYPTAAQLGGVFAAVADAIRTVDPSARVTADLTFPVVDVNPTRDTITQAITYLTTLFDGLDYWTLHTYISGSNFVGRNAYQPGVEPAPTNDYGFEALHTICRLFSEAAKAQGKALAIGEIGVHTGEETAPSVTKIRRGLLGCMPYCEYVLIWNVQEASRAPGSGQSTWFIDAGTTRGNAYGTLVASLNKFPALPAVSVGSILAPRSVGPRKCFVCSRTAGTRITLPSFPKMVSPSYAFAAWLRVDAELTAFETICDFRSSTTAGFIVLGSASAATSWYAEFRRSGGNAGSTAGIMPNIPVGTWQHIAVVYTPGSPNNLIDVYLDGCLWATLVNVTPMVAIPDATTLYVGGGGSGSPVSLQDVALMPYASPDDIVRHMCGEVNPNTFLHIRASDGAVQDISRFANALTVGASVVVASA